MILLKQPWSKLSEKLKNVIKIKSTAKWFLSYWSKRYFANFDQRGKKSLARKNIFLNTCWLIFPFLCFLLLSFFSFSFPFYRYFFDIWEMYTIGSSFYPSPKRNYIVTFKGLIDLLLCSLRRSVLWHTHMCTYLGRVGPIKRCFFIDLFMLLLKQLYDFQQNITQV